MKKIIALALCAVLCLGLLAGCGEEPAPSTETTPASDPATEPSASGELEQIVVGATSTPHAEVLEAVRGELEALGYDLQVEIFNDYVLPNTSLADGSLDANYFQHGPYLTQFNSERGTDLVNVASIHYEPMGIYPGSKATLDELADGDTIAIPNDGSNETRALLILQDLGYITLKEGIDASSNATILDVVDSRLETAKEMGADMVINSKTKDPVEAMNEFTGGEGFNLIYEATGNVNVLQMCIQKLPSPAGRVVVLGFSTVEFPIRQVDIMSKELEIIGTRLNNYRFPEVIEWFKEGKVDPKSIVTNTFPFTEADKAFKYNDEHPENVLKIVLTF